MESSPKFFFAALRRRNCRPAGRHCRPAGRHLPKCRQQPLLTVALKNESRLERTTDTSHMHEHLRIGTHTTALARLHLDATSVN